MSLSVRPNIFEYEDFRVFLKDWFEFRKSSDPEFSMRALARKSSIGSGYLPMVMSGTRNLTAKALFRLSPYLKLSASEMSYLELLRKISEPKKSKDREQALERLKAARELNQLGPLSHDQKSYQYLARWYYVAIRELIDLEGFQSDPKWIQANLKAPISIAEIKEAIEFLLAEGYIEKTPDGGLVRKDKQIDCLTGAYRVALAQFHREMFHLASRSFDNTVRQKRRVKGYTVALNSKQYQEIRKIIDEAHRAISKVSERDRKLPSGSVYHVSLCAFPLTREMKEVVTDEES